MSKEDLYGAFVDYYGDIELGLIKCENNWAIYGAKMATGLNLNRYLFVISPAYRGCTVVPEKETLNNLDWVSLQTRTTDDLHPVPVYNLFLNDTRKKALSDRISILERTAEESVFVTEYLPIKIKLLHEPKKRNILQYPDKALLYQALESYNCVIELL